MEKVTTTIRIPKNLDEKIMEKVNELGISKNASVILILNEYFKQEKALKEMSQVSLLLEKLKSIDSE